MVLQQAYKAQESRLSRLEKQLDSFMASQTQGRGDIASNSHSAHHVIAREYDVLVEQKVQGLARATAGVAHGEFPNGVPPTLWLMSRICMVLFGPGKPDGETVLAVLGRGRLDQLAPQTARLCEAALNLRRRSAQTGLPCHWDFEIVPGQLIDEEWQEAWPSCERTLPGQFVISPAYVVAEQIYSRQRVFTSIPIPN
ncbi:hypothetical protein ACGH2B_12890 [Streptomyces sp. BBFR2]|uniref:hypothetical protein n=1 Tax=Streptomyces sp. BBFR2 TaxID=3372854 RepID=UPI0037D9FE81